VPYRATGKSWTLDVAEAGASGPRAMLDAFLHEIRAVRLEQVEMARLGLRLTDEEYAELRQRLSDLLDEYARRPPSAQGRPYSVFLSVHPDVDRD
jgi:hypothetical protein